MDIRAMVEAGELTGSKTALQRIRKTKVCYFQGTNGLGDLVFSLGRLPREHAPKTLYLKRLERSQTGAKYRAYVARTP